MNRSFNVQTVRDSSGGHKLRSRCANSKGFFRGDTSLGQDGQTVRDSSGGTQV